MVWQFTAYAMFALGAAIVSALVALLAWRHRSEPDARQFMALMLTLGGWSLVYAVQLGVTTLTGQLAWQRVALAVGGLVPTVWLLFTLTYSGRGELLTRNRAALLAVDPVAFALLVFTNPRHGLAWSDATLVGPPTQRVLDLSLNAGYYVHIVYAYALVAAGLVLLADVYARASSLYRKQTGLLILGTLPPFAANVAFTFGLSPGPLLPVDLTPFAFVITGVAFGLALFQFDILERVPVARRRVLDEMGDGLVVLDAEGTVVDANDVARRTLDPEPAVGEPMPVPGPGSGSGAGLGSGDAVDATLADLDGRTITASVDSRQRAYDVDCSSMTDHRGATAGHVLGFRDVTDRQEYEERLEVAQRVLRHNLRNDMNVIRGWGQYIAESSANSHSEAASVIVETADDLIDLSEKAETMVAMNERANARRVPVDAWARLDAILDEFAAEYPEVTIERDLADAAIELPDESFFDIAVRNVVENAIEHNEAVEPWVCASVVSEGGAVRVRVADNGPPIPEIEREVLRDGVENPLRHGSGIGLWLTHWSLSTVGGEISFESREPRGNVVVLAFLADQQRSGAGNSPPSERPYTDGQNG